MFALITLLVILNLQVQFYSIREYPDGRVQNLKFILIWNAFLKNTYFKGRVRDGRYRERHLLSIGSLLKQVQQQAEARSQKLQVGFLHGWQEQHMVHHLLFPQTISRELDRKWSSWVLSQYPFGIPVSQTVAQPITPQCWPLTQDFLNQRLCHSV